MLHHRFKGSSALTSARYNPETRQLDVTFVSGQTYSHEGVPPDEFEALVGASSAGRHYLNNIKGVY